MHLSQLLRTMLKEVFFSPSVEIDISALTDDDLQGLILTYQDKKELANLFGEMTDLQAIAMLRVLSPSDRATLVLAHRQLSSPLLKGLSSLNLTQLQETLDHVPQARQLGIRLAISRYRGPSGCEPFRSRRDY